MSEEEDRNTRAKDAINGVPRVARARIAKSRLQKLDLRNRNFEDLNGLETEFTDCDFSYSIFHRGYFRDAKFTSCSFIGCRFYDCNFKSANFYNCDLKFAKFHRSQLETSELIVALPFQPNIRRESLQNLMANAFEIGDFASIRILVLHEIAATVDHNWRALRGTDTYYRGKYSSILSKVEAGWNLLSLYISGFVWGHGERPGRIFMSGSIFLLALTLVNFWSVMPREGWQSTLAGLKVLQYTSALFFGLPTDQHFAGYYAVDVVIAAMRYIYVGLFIAVLHKKMSHR